MSANAGTLSLGRQTNWQKWSAIAAAILAAALAATLLVQRLGGTTVKPTAPAVRPGVTLTHHAVDYAAAREAGAGGITAAPSGAWVPVNAASVDAATAAPSGAWVPVNAASVDAAIRASGRTPYSPGAACHLCPR